MRGPRGERSEARFVRIALLQNGSELQSETRPVARCWPIGLPVPVMPRGGKTAGSGDTEIPILPFFPDLPHQYRGLFDDVVGAGKQRRRDFEAEGASSLEVDD